jgi:hypothetical protein
VRITRDARRRATPVTMTDAQRQRLLFIVTGSGLGAIGGASLVVLLRSPDSPDMPPVWAAVSSLCGACLFGILWAFLPRFGLNRPELAMSPPRRWALSSALLVFIVTVGWIVAMTTFAGVSALALRRMSLLSVAGFMVLAHGASAVIVTELVRTTFARTAGWSDRRHFAGVGLLWMLFSTTGVLLLWRMWRKLGWS